jgi:hypothetical protein
MDPQILWAQLLSAYAEGDYDVMEERATELMEHLDGGGFPPQAIDRPDFDPDFQGALVRAGCRFTLDIVQSQWSPV